MLKLNFLGDIMLGELLDYYKQGVKTKIETKNIDPFKYCKKIFQEADLNIANLECPISDKSCLQKPFSEVLIIPSSFTKILNENNINLVNIANNHMLDHGFEAFNKTINNLKKKGILYFGYDKNSFFQNEPLVININDMVIFSFGYNIANYKSEKLSLVINKIQKIVKVYREKCDLLILSLHWGYEYTNVPAPMFIEIGKELIKSGVDILYGHHSHRIQGVVKIDNKIFAPSMGNFIFSDLRKEQRITAILQVYICEKKKIDYKLIPFYINECFQPVMTNTLSSYFNSLENKLKHLYYSEDSVFLEKQNKIIQNKVISEHKKNRISIRLRILKNIFFYFRFFPQILIFYCKGLKKSN